MRYRELRKPKIIVAILVSIMILLAVLCQCVYFQETRRIEETRFVFSVNDSTTEQVSLHLVDGDYYAFLPAYADLSTTRISISNGYTLYIDSKEYDRTATCTALNCDQKYSIAIKNPFGFFISDETLIIKKADNIPTLSLHLSDGTLASLKADRTVSKSGTALLVSEDKNINYFGAFKELHGRGNSTWSQPKKSYSLTFEIETDLLDMGAGTDWVLLANSLDESSLRNKLVYDTAQAMGLPFACNTAYINLYVDNQYQGLYLLAERIDVGANRVNITNLQENTQSVNQIHLSNYSQVEKITDGKIQRGYDIVNNPSDISGGYLLQIEHHADRIELKESLIQTETLSFSLSHPKYASKEQIAYISEYMNEVEQKIKTGDLSCIDIDSFALLYLLQEYFANSDNCSVFIYKDVDQIDTKLYAGPIWDFDLSIGNGFLTSETRSAFLHRNNDNWFQYLLECDQFTSCLQELYWNEFKPNAEVLIDQKLQDCKSAIESSFTMDKLRWKGIIGNNNWGDTCQKRFDTLDQHISRIQNYLSDRSIYLDSIWGNQEGYSLLTFCSGDIGDYEKKFYLKNGTASMITPNPVSEKTADYRFIGWFDPEGNQFDPNEAITHTVTYTAKWKQAESDEQNKTQFFSLNSLISSISKQTLIIGMLCVAILGFVIIDITRELKNKRCKNGE